MSGIMAGLRGGAFSAALTGASSIAAGESWQRALAKTLFVGGSAALVGGLTGGTGAMPTAIIASMFADKAADAFGLTKYNGNFPTAANGFMNAINKESLMSGNKGLVIANQDEVIAPAHRLGQLADMVGSRSGGIVNQKLLDSGEKLRQKNERQMEDLLRETRNVNLGIRQMNAKTAPSGGYSGPPNINLPKEVADKINIPGLQGFDWGKAIGDVLGQIPSQLIGLLRGLLPGGNGYNGNFPIAANGLFGAMNKEMLMSGNKGIVIANKDEIIAPPHRLNQLADLIGTRNGTRGGSIGNQNITINVNMPSGPLILIDLQNLSLLRFLKN
jgi:hypothetical protein